MPVRSGLSLKRPSRRPNKAIILFICGQLIEGDQSELPLKSRRKYRIGAGDCQTANDQFSRSLSVVSIAIWRRHHARKNDTK